MRVASAQPRPGLHLGEEKERRHDRIRDVGCGVHLQSIEMQHAADHHRQQQMKSEERQTADERADADRGGVAIRTGILEAEMLEEATGEPPTVTRHRS